MKRDFGALWHALAGLGVGGLASLIPDLYGLLIVGLVAVVGWGREVLQHDLKLTWPHQWLEALAWGAGGIVGYVAVSFF